MPGRSYIGNGYRYGFNGKEKDDEVSGNGNQYDYGFRIYNPRLGRFLSVDPLSRSYPMLTPYQFASNNPTSGIDVDGLEYLNSNIARVEFVNGVIQVKLQNLHTVSQNTVKSINENPNNWARAADGTLLEVGVSLTIADFLFRTPQTEPSSSDIGSNMTANHSSFPEKPDHTPQPRNRQERRELDKELKKNPKAYKYPTSGKAKAGSAISAFSVVLDAGNFAADNYIMDISLKLTTFFRFKLTTPNRLPFSGSFSG